MQTAATSISLRSLPRVRREQPMSTSDRLSRLQSEILARDAMIEEMDHRVKNHLQLIASYARSLAREPGETAAHVAHEIATRLSMVAAIHDVLHMNRASDCVEARSFLTRVCHSLADGQHQIDVVCDEDLTLSAEELAPVGMILVEAVCNCLKHGFPQGRAGSVAVAFRRHDGERILEIFDDGIGFDPTASPGGGSGLRLMQAFAKRLRGDFAISRNRTFGATVKLILPMPLAGAD